MSPDTVSVLIPVLNEESAIRECVRRVLDQSRQPSEVLVADGGSTDRSCAIVRELAESDPRVRLIDNPRRVQGAGLNEALAQSKGSIVVRLDARSFIEPDYIERCVASMSTHGAAAVGGRMVPRPGAGDMAAGIALANRSPWGAGPARFHTGGGAGPVETVYLGTFDRSWLDRVGGWAEDVGVNEDYELNHRIRSSGGIVWFDPVIEVAYEPRRTLAGVAKQYWRYGWSKAIVIARHPGSVRLRQILPVGLLVLAVGAVLPGCTNRLARLGLIAHAGLVAAGASRSPASSGVRVRAAVAAWVMHWAWSAGFWRGMVSLASGRSGR